MYKNILVTGGCGFIGTHLVDRLKSLDYNVITVDLKPEADYSFDISKYKNFEKIKENIDVIYHTAGQSYGYKSLEEPELDIDWNAKGTLNVCTFAKNKKVKKIIYTSTMAVYGEGDWLEETDKLNPLSNYGISKLYGETCVKQFSQFDIDYTIFRVFNTYGPKQNLIGGRQGVVAVFLAQVIKASLRQLVYSKGVFLLRYGSKLVDQEIYRSAITMICCFFAFLVIFTLSLSLCGLDLITALSGATTALANVGPGLGETIGPAGNFGGLDDLEKYILIVAMVLGRLELLVAMAFFLPMFWRH